MNDSQRIMHNHLLSSSSEHRPLSAQVANISRLLALGKDILNPLDLVLGNLLLVGPSADTHARLHSQNTLLVD
jgi:hypothetical protein